MEENLTWISERPKFLTAGLHQTFINVVLWLFRKAAGMIDYSVYSNIIVSFWIVGPLNLFCISDV